MKKKLSEFICSSAGIGCLVLLLPVLCLIAFSTYTAFDHIEVSGKSINAHLLEMKMDWKKRQEEAKLERELEKERINHLRELKKQEEARLNAHYDLEAKWEKSISTRKLEDLFAAEWEGMVKELGKTAAIQMMYRKAVREYQQEVNSNPSEYELEGIREKVAAMFVINVTFRQ